MTQTTEVTIALLVQGRPPSHILLGWKKRGLGQAQYAGIGGKIEPGESAREAAVRELREETGVSVALGDLRCLGKLTFTFPCKPEWSQIAHVFLVSAWQGQASETAEMRPAWFAIDQIPYETMWHDYSFWLSRAIQGQDVTSTFTYAADNKTVQTARLGKGVTTDKRRCTQMGKKNNHR